MTFTSLRAAALLAACLAGAAALAQDGPPPPGAERGDGPSPVGRGPGGPGLHFLRGVELSDAQQDRLFAILHEAAPKRREQDKALRKAHEALREAAAGATFDDAKAVAATQALGRVVAAAELLRVRTEAQAMALLTPQQREALRTDRAVLGPRP